MGDSPGKSTARPARTGAPGGRRGEVQEAKLLDAVEYLLLHNTSRHNMSVALAEEFGRPRGTPIPLATVDDYIAKANVRLEEEAELTRAQTKKRQRMRLYRRLRALRGGGHNREAIETEKLIAKIEGNIAPVEVSGPGGGPIPVRAQPEILSAFDRLAAAKTG